MADTEQLRARIEEQRMEITGTVEQIENRIMPSRIMARRRDGVRRTLTDWRDTVFGTDEPGHPATTSALESAKEGVQHAPQVIRRQARGNPMAAGAVALGAGWLVATVLPRTQEERAMARRMEPKLAEAASAVKSEGQALASDLEEPARDAVQQVKQTGQEVASEMRDEAKEAASSVRSDGGR